MNKRVALPGFTVALAFAFVFALTSKLFAIAPIIEATAACVNGQHRITYTASSNFDATNPSVDILFDGVVVDNGAWDVFYDSFSNTLPAPAGKGGGTVNVSLLVIGTWTYGNSFPAGGQTAETTVTLVADCTPPPSVGCTPGYWKQSQHFDSWVNHSPSDSFNALPGFNSVSPDVTLLQALEIKGDGNALGALLRATVAALLNIEAGDYGMTLVQLQTAFNAALASGGYETLKNQLDALNNAGCTLD